MVSDPQPAPTVARSIRPFRTADAETILRILHHSGEAAQWSTESYVKLADSPGGLLLVCEMEVNAQLIGLIAARHVTNEAEILNLAVHPHFRREGVASALLVAALEMFRRSRVSRVFLELRESNLAAGALYLRHGFVLSGRRKGYYQHPAEDALCMHRKFTDIRPRTKLPDLPS